VDKIPESDGTLLTPAWLCHPMRKAWLLETATNGGGADSISEMLFLAAELHLVLLAAGPCRSTGKIAMIKANLCDVYETTLPA